MKNRPTYEELENQIAELTRKNEILKLAEKSNSISEVKHQKMIHNIRDVIAIFDREGLNIYKSPNAEKYFGWTHEDILGRSTLENIHPEDINEAQVFMESLIGEPNSIKTAEFRYRCKNGNYKWIEISCVNLLHDPDINGVLANYHDITERKKSEQALQFSEHKFRILFETITARYYFGR